MQASTYQDLMLSLKGYVATQELSEARRLLYVALTRASKSLFIGMAHSGNKNFSYNLFVCRSRFIGILPKRAIIPPVAPNQE